jgi:hypothetical protein
MGGRAKKGGGGIINTAHSLRVGKGFKGDLKGGKVKGGVKRMEG